MADEKKDPKWVKEFPEIAEQARRDAEKGIRASAPGKKKGGK